MDYHFDPILLPTVDANETGISRVSVDRWVPIIAYGHAFLDMGGTHDLIIFNSLNNKPSSTSFTCFPHKGRANVVDYLMGSLAIPHIPDFTISPLPLGADHTYLFLTIFTSRPYHTLPNPTYPHPF